MAIPRSLRLVLLAVTTLWLVPGALLAQEQERKITQADLPAAVAKGVAVQSQGATLKGLAEEKEAGQTYYEAELLAGGLTRDLLFDTTGTVVEIEQQVVFDSLPPAVRSALTTRAGQGTIVRVESLTKRGSLVAYEAHVKTNGKSSEIQVGPAGEALAHEE
jgi:hypothetical protein